MKNNDRYRVEIIQKNNHRAWSSPIWIKINQSINICFFAFNCNDYDYDFCSYIK